MQKRGGQILSLTWGKYIECVEMDPGSRAFRQKDAGPDSVSRDAWSLRVALYCIRMNSPLPRRPLRALCPLWVWTLCLALALRALVPSGTMLDLENRNGFFPGLVLCPVQNPGMPAGGHHHSDDRPQNHASPLCLLAQHAGGSPLPAAAPTPASAAQAAVAPFLPGIAAPVARRVRWVPLGSRAPPPPFI